MSLDHLVLKVASESHMTAMRSMAFLWEREEVNKIDLEVILGEVLRQLTSGAKCHIVELGKSFPH